MVMVRILGLDGYLAGPRESGLVGTSQAALETARLDAVVGEDALVAWHHDMVDEGTLSAQWDLVAAGLVDPPQREALIVRLGARTSEFTAGSVGHRVIWIKALFRLLHCL